uniref:Uncharacterized protein n=1 Tax=Noctiluca scintillans TaxID=2966 RepID=A0A7S1ATE0_NOCSC|mmetsp:Transcript_58765/g.156364  ORF Transcript_58765/g.156364 Transcript_58765/m.156364 type:complete len:240 (+) Transcript_58765:64-783(+)|eukprot:CAMPEP_0194492848 /NCGR_PEP_ID=MMETSP0253-20130528/11259_1 /TAXON_ID=2966 /ORGANISM="Noctiluca scintillans" /LENGTH=239 /DNA_ID=CAMNT_0039333763 /DNA_START=58 /DNA_END=777 /DNA_ORIENTATION=-
MGGCASRITKGVSEGSLLPPPKPSDKFRTASKNVEKLIITAIAIFICITAVGLVVSAYMCYESDDFQNANDLLKSVQSLTSNPVEFKMLVVASGIAGIVTVIVFLGGIGAVFSGGIFAIPSNVTFLVMVLLCAFVLLGLGITLFVFSFVYGELVYESLATICIAPLNCDEDSFHTGVLLSRVVSVSTMTLGMFCATTSCCIGCFLYETIFWTSALDCLDFCGLMSRYDRLREARAPAVE